MDLFGITPEEMDSPRVQELFHEASPIDFVSPGDPPVFMWYSIPNGPITADTSLTDRIHHPKFGNLLKAKLEQYGIECIVRYGDEFEGETKDEKMANMDPTMVAFFRKHFGLEG